MLQYLTDAQKLRVPGLKKNKKKKKEKLKLVLNDPQFFPTKIFILTLLGDMAGLILVQQEDYCKLQEEMGMVHLPQSMFVQPMVPPGYLKQTCEPQKDLQQRSINQKIN